MKRKVWATMTECFELIDRKLLKGPWVMGEQYTICGPPMAAGYSADRPSCERHGKAGISSMSASVAQICGRNGHNNQGFTSVNSLRNGTEN